MRLAADARVKAEKEAEAKGKAAKETASVRKNLKTANRLPERSQGTRRIL